MYLFVDVFVCIPTARVSVRVFVRVVLVGRLQESKIYLLTQKSQVGSHRNFISFSLI